MASPVHFSKLITWYFFTASDTCASVQRFALRRSANVPSEDVPQPWVKRLLLVLVPAADAEPSDSSARRPKAVSVME